MANITKDGAINGTVDVVSVSIEYDGSAGGAYVFTNSVPPGSVIKDITVPVELIVPPVATLPPVIVASAVTAPVAPAKARHVISISYTSGI